MIKKMSEQMFKKSVITTLLLTSFLGLASCGSDESSDTGQIDNAAANMDQAANEAAQNTTNMVEEVQEQVDTIVAEAETRIETAVDEAEQMVEDLEEEKKDEMLEEAESRVGNLLNN